MGDGEGRIGARSGRQDSFPTLDFFFDNNNDNDNNKNNNDNENENDNDNDNDNDKNYLPIFE